MEVLVLLLLIITSFAVVAANNVTAQDYDHVSQIRHLIPKAQTTDFTPTDIAVQRGATAYLPCKFRNLAEDQVTWIRRRDFDILTTGISTYTRDTRFTVQHPLGSDIWTLQLKYAEAKDSGTYECQLSTGTGIASQFVNLDVVEARVMIVGGSEYHVQTGSSVKLVCLIEQSPTPPEFVFWYVNDTMVNFDTMREDIFVITESSNGTTSTLTINNASVEDSGNYSCQASNSNPVYTNVFVSLGDKTAAIQPRKSSSGHSLPGLMCLLLSLLIIVFSCSRWNSQDEVTIPLQLFLSATNGVSTLRLS